MARKRKAMLQRVATLPRPGDTIATAKDLLVAKLAPGSPIPAELAAMPEGPRVAAPTLVDTSATGAATVPGNAAVLQPPAKPETTPVNTKGATLSPDALLGQLGRLTSITKIGPASSPELEHLVNRQLIVAAHGYYLITPRGLGYLLDFGLL